MYSVRSSFSIASHGPANLGSPADDLEFYINKNIPDGLQARERSTISRSMRRPLPYYVLFSACDLPS